VAINIADATGVVCGRRRRSAETWKNPANYCRDSLAEFGNAWLMCVIGRRFFIHPNGEI